MEGRGDKERFDDLVASIAACQELAASQAVRACVEPLINQPYRLIESYALRRDQDSVFYLHNGNSEILRYGSSTVQRNMSFSHTFHDGKLFCMFVKVLIYLTDVAAQEDGPFCYLQGSHKANWPRFPDPDSAEAQPDLTTANFPSLRLGTGQDRGRPAAQRGIAARHASEDEPRRADRDGVQLRPSIRRRLEGDRQRLNRHHQAGPLLTRRSLHSAPGLTGSRQATCSTYMARECGRTTAGR